MKLEIISGENDKRKKNNCMPVGKNTIVKIDGKEYGHCINDFYFSVRPDRVAFWGISLKDETLGKKIKFSMKKFKWKILRWLNIW